MLTLDLARTSGWQSTGLFWALVQVGFIPDITELVMVQLVTYLLLGRALLFDERGVAVIPTIGSVINHCMPHVFLYVLLPWSLLCAVLSACAVRTMHLHRGVDEAYLVLEGRVGFAMAAPNGTIISEPALGKDGVFIIPANWIHTVSCLSAHSFSCLVELLLPTPAVLMFLCQQDCKAV